MAEDLAGVVEDDHVSNRELVEGGRPHLDARAVRDGGLHTTALASDHDAATALNSGRHPAWESEQPLLSSEPHSALPFPIPLAPACRPVCRSAPPSARPSSRGSSAPGSRRSSG